MRLIGHEGRSEQGGERPFFRSDLEAIHVEDESRKKQEGKSVGQENCPPGQNQEKSEIHRVAGPSINAQDHQRR